MTFVHLLWLIVVVWFLGSFWIAMYFGHAIKRAEMVQRQLDSELEIEQVQLEIERVHLEAERIKRGKELRG